MIASLALSFGFLAAGAWGVRRGEDRSDDALRFFGIVALLAAIGFGIATCNHLGDSL